MVEDQKWEGLVLELDCSYQEQKDKDKIGSLSQQMGDKMFKFYHPFFMFVLCSQTVVRRNKYAISITNQPLHHKPLRLLL
jgi:hypothetical protein